MIVTLTGGSGAGKSTICNRIMDVLGATLITSFTTRAQDPRDLPFEYQYMTKNVFEDLKNGGTFLWDVEAHGNQYGTPKRSVDDAMADEEVVRLMILTHSAVGTLREYTKSKNLEDNVLSFYILANGEVRRERLLADVFRGSRPAEDVERRVRDCEKWDLEALNSRIPYVFVENNGTIDVPVKFIKDLIGDYQSGL